MQQLHEQEQQAVSDKANVSTVKSFLDSVIQENGLQVAPQPESQPLSSVAQNVADFTGA